MQPQWSPAVSDGGKENERSYLKKSNALCANSFLVLQQVLDSHSEFFLDNFAEGVKALLAFAQCQSLSSGQALEAVNLLLQAARVLAQKIYPHHKSNSKTGSAVPSPTGSNSGTVALTSPPRKASPVGSDSGALVPAGSPPKSPEEQAGMS